jgi:hypothetical protein
MDVRIANENTTGGSDGCMAFSDPDNFGLPECIVIADIVGVYQKYCGQVSLADFLVIAAEAVMGRTASSYDKNDYYGDGSTAKSFIERFSFGRTTQNECP